jgi:PAS domain S-box-containing protein
VVVLETAVGDLLDTAPCGFVSFTDDGLIQYINSTLLERLGYDRDDVLNQHVETLMVVGSRIFYQTHFFPLLKLHGRAQEIFLLLRAKSGEDVGMLCNAIRRERDGLHVTDCVFLEVVERRKFEEALVQARLVADDANRAKSNFLAVMSHELRTPLNAIGGYVQLLQMGVHGPVTEGQIVALDRIDRSQRHLLRLINEILNLARIEAGRVEYSQERVSLSEVVGNVLPMIDPQARAKHMRLEAVVANGVSAQADREKVQQILLNLLTNAIKFTSEGGSIRVEAGELQSSRVFLRVHDTGRGIPPHMLQKIFEPFVQVDTSRSRAVEGTGLGLAISRDLARGMGGDLIAESTLGEGSVFQLTLPAGVA